MKKPFSVRSKHFIAVNEASNPEESFRYPWVVSRRAEKNGPEEQAIGEVCFSVPDGFQCSSMSVELKEELTSNEYAELLSALQSGMASAGSLTFVKTGRPEKEALLTALQTLGYGEDDTDPRSLLWEKPIPSWISIYMCLGLSVGMGLGIATSLGQGTGMCLGIALGSGLGVLMQNNEKKRRETLRASRRDAESISEE